MFKNAGDLPKSTNEEERQRNIQSASKNGEFNNPCFSEQKLSYKCLSDNNYNRDSCNHFFANYKRCQDFWLKVRDDRRKEGLTPLLPNPEDREKAKEEYIKKLNFH